MNTTAVESNTVAAPDYAAPAPQNWALYLFVVLIPLQNVYLQYAPDFGGGLNFLNLMLIASFLMALRCGGGLVRGAGVNGWVMIYIAGCALAFMNGLDNVADPTGHGHALKDQLIAVAFVFLAQMSVTDRVGLHRMYVASLLPLPYIFYVLRDQNAAVSSWHYSDQMRINATFMELGANEMAAFFVTACLVAFGLLIGARVGKGWRAVYALAAVLASIGVVLSYSRTAYIAILAGLAVVLLLSKARMKLLLPALAVLLILPLFMPPAAVERFDSISIEEDLRDESTDSRFVFWAEAIHHFQENPLIGVGLHNFHHAEFSSHEMDVHNFYLRELVEKGVLGAVILLGLIWSVTRLLWRGLAIAEPGSWYGGLMLGLAGAWIALMIGNVFGDRFTHYPMIAHFWLYLGLALRGLQLRYAELDAQPEELERAG
ncbi:O-antigen ligase family protein [Wenzhouxiangella sp. EGI_FJ10305]|uniref:O-antigen ligase family protein n=1 Tax=Wenzhouxiangella sp. EGI_FJ10305 TaxID=3243768 RepID=UPI0035D71EA0